MNEFILVINPGSTSTKIAIFINEEQVFSQNIAHTLNELAAFSSIPQQYNYRKNIIIECLTKHNFKLSEFSAVVARGGLLKPLKSGTYSVNNNMLNDLKIGVQGEHASNLGGILAYDIAKDYNLPSFIVDPVVVDEMQDIAKISGFKGIERISIFHALNQKAVALEVAKKLNKTYKECNFIVIHLGGGISVGVHQKGMVIDVNNGLDGDGAFGLERSGGLPIGALIEFCVQHKHLTKAEILKNFVGQGGLISYCNTNSGIEINKRIQEGDKVAKLVIEAMAYQVAKEIGAALSVLAGNCDAIILTGGLAHLNILIEQICARIAWSNILIEVVAGEDEMKALALGALRVLNNVEEVKEY